LLDSYLAEMILSASINSIRIKSPPFKRATGSREKMKSWLNLFEKMAPSSGVRLLTSSMQISVSPEMESNAERGGSIS